MYIRKFIINLLITILKLLIMETQKVLSQLMAVKENENVKDLTVRNINTKDMSTWTRVSVTLDKPVKAYVVNEETGEVIEDA